MSETKYYESVDHEFHPLVVAQRDGKQWWLMTKLLHVDEVPGRAGPLIWEEEIKPHWQRADEVNGLADIASSPMYREVSRLNVAVLYGLREPPEMRIGLIGGTFNPFHHGHIRLGKWALKEYRLDKVLYIPNNIPSHKENEIVSAEHRYRMVQLGVEEEEQMEACDIEISRGGTSYTIDTIRALLEKDKENEYVLILGKDSYEDLPNWKEPEAIKELIDIVVYDQHEDIVPVRATSIRALIKRDQKLMYGLVPDLVAAYILKHHLYLEDE